MIGSDSGSVPYQIGINELIVPEGNVEALKEKIEWVLSHKQEAAEMGEKLYYRTKNGFEIKHLNVLFYDTLVEDILRGEYDINKFDMSTYNK